MCVVGIFASRTALSAARVKSLFKDNLDNSMVILLFSMIWYNERMKGLCNVLHCTLPLKRAQQRGILSLQISQGGTKMDCCHRHRHPHSHFHCHFYYHCHCHVSDEGGLRDKYVSVCVVTIRYNENRNANKSVCVKTKNKLTLSSELFSLFSLFLFFFDPDNTLEKFEIIIFKVQKIFSFCNSLT